MMSYLVVMLFKICLIHCSTHLVLAQCRIQDSGLGEGVEELQLEAGVRVLTTKKELSEIRAKRSRRKKSRVSRSRSKVVTSTPKSVRRQPELEPLNLDPEFD
ncbi:hypothetical protein AVEN_12229-1, partial [Araneus ventricosus]